MDWKDGIIIIACLLIGFALGYLIDFPKEITFHTSPELTKEIQGVRTDMVRVSELSLNASKEQCQVRLLECEKLCI